MTAIFALSGATPPPGAAHRAQEIVGKMPFSVLLQQVLSKAIEYDRNARFKTVREFHLALLEATRGKTFSLVVGRIRLWRTRIARTFFRTPSTILLTIFVGLVAVAL